MEVKEYNQLNLDKTSEREQIFMRPIKSRSGTSLDM